MTLKQFVIAVAAGAAAAIIVKAGKGKIGGETVSSGSKPIEGVGTGIP
jgi:predicted small secreted protein